MKEKSQRGIKSTATDKFKYFYTRIDEIVIVFCTDLNDEDRIITSKIKTLRAKFMERYGDFLAQRNSFARFERELDNVILEPIKVAIIGMGGSGKTELIRLICGKDINLEYQPTINVDITNIDGNEIGLRRSITLWDFAGQPNYRTLWPSLLDSTDIVLLVLDSTYESLNPIKDILRDIFKKHFKGKLVIGIANNQHMPNRLTPNFIERVLSNTGWDPPIKVHGMVPLAPYREKILTILRDAINEVYH
jgi:small GTP-binding protein